MGDGVAHAPDHALEEVHQIGRLVDDTDTLPGHRGDVGDVAADLVHGFGLLRGGSGDFGDHAYGIGHQSVDAVEAILRLMDQIDAPVDLAGAGSHAGDGAVAVFFDLREQGIDVGGGFHGAIGKVANFVGHDRKAAAGLSGTGGLDGSIEGQQVGLIGDLADHTRDLADFGRAGAERFDLGRRPS